MNFSESHWRDGELQATKLTKYEIYRRNYSFKPITHLILDNIHLLSKF